MTTINLHLKNLEEQYKLEYVAKQASGSVWYRSGGTILLASVAVEKTPIEADFLPLTVQYLHKSYALRKIPGGFIKREGKPSEFETLTSRIVDRTLRPLFPAGYYYPTQITILVLSYDEQSDLPLCALHAAANALLVSGLDFIPPVSSVRIGKLAENLASHSDSGGGTNSGGFIVNPTKAQMADSCLDLYVAGSGEDILMIEMKGADPTLDEAALMQAIALAKQTIASDCKQFASSLLPHKRASLALPLAKPTTHPHIYELIATHHHEQVLRALESMSKSERSDALDSIAHEILAQNPELELESIQSMLSLYKKHQVRAMILDRGRRADGRGLEDVRAISIETNILPCAHSSALFTRGETQALVVCTLGGENDAQIQEDFSSGGKERFLFHYNFPGFSVGEASMIGGVGRRELGHGNLAKKALESTLVSAQSPTAAKHTIRLVSEILESNGSSSMASVCGGSLALRAAGLENELVAGVAMGLVLGAGKDDKSNDASKYAVLTDIMGLEDHDGDMDFKIAGTRGAITAMQMDIKLGGIDSAILHAALMQAKRAREHILSIMENAAAHIVPNTHLLPKSELLHIPGHKIPDLIGPGGKVIKDIIDRFKVTIDIQREKEQILIQADSASNLEDAKAFITRLITPTARYESGERVSGVVKRVVDFGVFVSLAQGEDGLLHISKIPGSMQPLAQHFSEGMALECIILGSPKGKIELGL